MTGHFSELIFVDRDRYRKRLREAVLEFQVSLLTYNVTCNHVHLGLKTRP